MAGLGKICVRDESSSFCIPFRNFEVLFGAYFQWEHSVFVLRIVVIWKQSMLESKSAQLLFTSMRIESSKVTLFILYLLLCTGTVPSTHFM